MSGASPSPQYKPAVSRGVFMLPALVLMLTLFAALAATVRNAPRALEKLDASVLHDVDARRRVTSTLVSTALTRRAQRYQRQANWLLLHDLGDQVGVGDDGWLFLLSELRVRQDRQTDARRRADTLAAINRQLKARGIRLLVGIVPDKTRSAQAYLGRLGRPEVLEPRIRAFVEQLRHNDVAVLDWSGTLASPDSFLKTDTHWTEHGSLLAAEAWAAHMREFHLDAGPPVEARQTSREQADFWGDLIHLAGVDTLPTGLRPQPDHAWQSAIEIQSLDDDLFGDGGLPQIVLLGTSFSSRSNFLPFLERASGHAIANLSMDGGDFHGAARRYFSSSAFAEHPPATVLWEIPERALEMPIGAEESAWLAHPIPATASGGLEIRQVADGILAPISQPDPI